MKQHQILDLVIIGGGLTGLSLAHLARQAGLAVKLLEASERLGGQICTHHQNGFTYESGPNTGIISRVEVADLFDSLPQTDLLQTARPGAKRRLILRRGHFQPLPSGPISAVKTPLFSWYDKLRILAEPFRARGLDPNESIADLVVRRLGRTYLDYAVDPFVGGIYAGDPHRLVTRFALPKLYALEAEYGSFIRGAIAKMRTSSAQTNHKPSKEVFSVRGGLSNLIAALGGSVGREHIICSAQIEDMIPRSGHNPWQIRLNHQGQKLQLQSQYVVSTVGTYALAHLFPFLGAKALAPLLAMRYAPIVQVAIGYRKTHDLRFDAFGGLIPSSEDPHLLGILNPSACFQGRAPEGGVLLSLFLGGMRSPNLIEWEDQKIRHFVLDRLKSILGLEHQPDLLHIFRHRYAIPQYEASSEQRLATIDALEAEYTGLILAGNLKDGIGMADRIGQAYSVLRRIQKELLGCH